MSAQASEGATEVQGRGGAFGDFVRLRLRAGQVVVVRAGTSFTSLEAARRNLAAEIGGASFDAVRARAEPSWEDALSRIRVSGGTEAQQHSFYTAFYRSLLMPRLFSDVDGGHPRFADGGAVEAARGFDYDDDFSLWDTLRALHPLLAKAEQGSLVPSFPAWNSYTSAMIGDRRLGQGRARLRRRGSAARPSE